MARKWRKPGTWTTSEDKVMVSPRIDEVIRACTGAYIAGMWEQYKRAIEAFEILLITDIDDEYEQDLIAAEKKVVIKKNQYSGPVKKRDTVEFQTLKFKALMSLLNRGTHSREKVIDGLLDDDTADAIIAFATKGKGT